MHPVVCIRTPAGKLVELGPGDMIGRSERAALCLSEPHISEAHAMVSLRAGELRLLGLRGRFSVDGKATAQVTLRAGQRIVLASRTALEVVEVRLPEEVLALVSEDFGPFILASVSSLRVAPEATLVVGFVPDADAIFWTLDTRLYVRVGDAPARELVPGSDIIVGDRRFGIVATALDSASHVPTQESSEVGAPLHLILNYDTVHIIAGPHRLTLDGIAARILSELAAVRVPIAWQEVAREIWGKGEDVAEEILRERWDSSLGRIRRKLKEARLRTDLVHATRAGHVELRLAPGDTMEDRM